MALEPVSRKAAQPGPVPAYNRLGQAK